jgi:hypothetical protein
MAPISPGLYLVSRDSSVLFKPGEKASAPFERIAEDGDPGPLVEVLNKTDGAEM